MSTLNRTDGRDVATEGENFFGITILRKPSSCGSIEIEKLRPLCSIWAMRLAFRRDCVCAPLLWFGCVLGEQQLWRHKTAYSDVLPGCRMLKVCTDSEKQHRTQVGLDVIGYLLIVLVVKPLVAKS